MEIGGRFNVFSSNVLELEAITLAAERDYQHTVTDSWIIDGKEFKPELIAEASRIYQSTGWDQILLSNIDYVAFSRITTSGISIVVWAVSAEKAKALVQHVKDIMPVFEQEDERVMYRFYTLTKDGPQKFNRKLEVPTWRNIRPNYAPVVQKELDFLTTVKDGEALRDGRLILWRGIPGTGKTYALRALSREWKEWCDFFYITDTDEFFGSGASYMMDVVLADNDDDRWKLLILEDAGELLASDAKKLMGQGLSRLLNVVDGVLGQGLKFLVMVTTNEELSRLHEAVTRSGRCASRLEFPILFPEEANKWLKSKGYKGEAVTRSCPVAELYAILNGNEFPVERTRAIGFG